MGQHAVEAAHSLFRQAERIYLGASPSAEQERTAVLKYEAAGKLYRIAGQQQKVRECDLKIGNLLQSLSRFREAIAAYHTCLSDTKFIADATDSLLFQPYLFLGDAYYALDNYDSAQWHYEKALEIAGHFPRLPEIERLYNSLGALQYENGNYLQSINYFEKAAAYIQNKTHRTETDQQLLLFFKNNIASSFRKRGQYQQAISLYKALLRYPYGHAALFQNIGHAYLLTGNTDSALYYLDKVKQPADASAHVRWYNDMGQVFLQKGNTVKALQYFNRSIVENQSLFGQKKNEDLARSYINLGQLWLSKKEPRNALQCFQQAIIASDFSFNDTAIDQNPDLQTEAVSLLTLIEALGWKATVLGQPGPSSLRVKYLEMAFHTYELAIDLADRVRRSFDSDEAKLFFSGSVQKLYESAVSTALELYRLRRQAADLAAAFRISEKSKAAVLAESIQQMAIKQQGGISGMAWKREQELKQKIARLYIRLGAAADSAVLLAIRTQLREAEISLLQLQQSFEKNDRYHQLKYHSQVADLTAVQRQLLDGRTALLSYMEGADRLYVFVITAQRADAVQIPMNRTFRQQLADMKKALYDFEDGQKYQGSAAAYFLFRKLIQPVYPLIKDKKHWIILPDGTLNYLPFEVLTTAANPGSFLLEKHSFQYAYSATLLMQVGNPVSIKAPTVLAFAPFAKPLSKGGFSAWYLPQSGVEVADLPGNESIYISQGASKRNFLQTVSQYNLIHLATHAWADNEHPAQSYIAFYPERMDSAAAYRLYMPELYNLDLSRARLVVLSACESGGGQVIKGEGTMSLARAFAYAGCPNTVATLWKANDVATAQISQRFYYYLQKGVTLPEALQKAKLDYLHSGVAKRLKQPYYWAHFIFIGTNTVVYPREKAVWWWMGGLLLLAILGLLVVYCRHQQSSLRRQRSCS